jgi:DNA-binding MarR family transcriptional regulator
MSKLSDTQAVILSAASQRDDGTVLPLPESLKIKGGAVQKVLASLERKELIARVGEPRGDDPPPLCITRAGLTTIGVKAGAGTDEVPFVEVTDAPQGGTEAQEGVPTDGEADASEATPAARPRAVREGTKQAQMIDLLKRPEGTTIEQIAKATGWQKHTIRGAISGALKKKLGLAVTSEKHEDGERIYRIADGGGS